MSRNSTPDVATRLSQRIVARSDFKDLVSAIESAVAESLLAHTKSGRNFDELLPLAMRFADILSYSSNESHRTQAYSLVALFQELKEQEQLNQESVFLLDAYSEAIFAALGNFPGLQKLEDSVDEEKYFIPADRIMGRGIKEELQRTTDGKHVLTDAQYKIANDLKRTDFYSFSGPTSLGKSFVIKDFIRSEVSAESFVNKCVVFVVPTNALVSQTARDLRRELSDIRDVNVAIHPVQPQLMLQRFRATIYVFTPERLIRYLSTRGREVELLVVDEAHRIVSPKDTRSPLFYYAIDQTLRTYASKLIFSSPSLSNPDLFLELFGKSSEGSVLIHERTVTQQRFFIDLIEKRAYYFSSLPGAESVEVTVADGFKSTTWESIEYWANGMKSLIYVNTPPKVVEFALSYEPSSGVHLNGRAIALINKIREEVHSDYYLIDALERGVAFHHGRIPVAIREEIEAVFKDPESGVNYLVCTSTLLEGVNLPARNLFVLTDKHGNGHEISKLDFENLAGRAGRLAQDYKGNVFCMRLNDNEWERPTEQIPQSEPSPVESFLLDPSKKKTKQFTDVERVLQQDAMPKGNTAVQNEIAEKYAAILTIQTLNNNTSLLTQKFNERAKDASSTLDKIKREVKVERDILRRSPEFDPVVQERVRQCLERTEQPVVIKSTDDLSFETLLDVFTELSRLYDWRRREGRGRNPMFRRDASESSHQRRLRYWTQLAFKWMTGSPIHMLIRGSLVHYENTEKIYMPDYSTTNRKSPYQGEDFDPESKIHVNYVIDETMSDIEYGVGFRILSYLKNYHNLCVQVFGEERAGLDLSVLIEFGTSDQTAIELQQVGYTRDASSELRDKGGRYLEILGDGTIASINAEGIISDELISDIVKQETRDLFVA